MNQCENEVCGMKKKTSYVGKNEIIYTKNI